MNRRQAKIYSKLTKEEVKELRPDFNTKCYEIMKAFSEGARVTFFGDPVDTFSFDGAVRCYKILPETHIINGREVPAPLWAKPKHGEVYWFIGTTEVHIDTWDDCNEDIRRFKIGNCFATEEDGQATFNAMWKIEE